MSERGRRNRFRWHNTVTCGVSRSIVNYDAGSNTPAYGAYTQIGLAGLSLFLTPLIYNLPKATLAATIIVAVLSLVNFSVLKKVGIIRRLILQQSQQR